MASTEEAPSRWLWGSRVIAILFGLACIAVGIGITVDYLKAASDHWSVSAYIGLGACLVLILCGSLPYVLVVWNLKSRETRKKGLLQAMIIGGFWFFVLVFLLADSAFHGAASSNLQRTPGRSAELLELALVIGLSITLPSGLLLISTFRSIVTHGSSRSDDAVSDNRKALSATRIGVVAALVLLAIPAILSPFTLWSEFTAVVLIIIESLLMVAVLPWVVSLRMLVRPKLQWAALTWVTGLAFGFLTLLLLAGCFYGFIAATTPSSRPHHGSTWAEIAFFCLLGLVSLWTLLAGLRLEMATASEGRGRLSIGAVAVAPLCLFVFSFLLLCFAESA